jgi:hypothetical protein
VTIVDRGASTSLSRPAPLCRKAWNVGPSNFAFSTAGPHTLSGKFDARSGPASTPR